MDGLDLMEFNSPPKAVKSSANNNNTTQCAGTESLAFFKDFDMSPGKESLGILKLEEEAFILSGNTYTQNTGEETFVVETDVNISPGKESLGILKLEEQALLSSRNIDSQNTEKESLAFLKNVNISPGKESLGILKLEDAFMLSGNTYTRNAGEETFVFEADVNISPGKESLGILKLEEQALLSSRNIDLQNTEKESLAFLKNVNISPGKESLGILKLDTQTFITPENLNTQYNGRDSLTFLKNINISPGKESLGILKLDEQALVSSGNIDLQNTEKESFAFLKNVNISPGKESLGILKLEEQALIVSPNVERESLGNRKLEKQDFISPENINGRESLLSLKNVKISPGKESLGIFKLEAPTFISPENITTQNSGRESLSFLKNINISPGKESLGILKLEALNSSFNANNQNAPSINLSACEEQILNISDNPLNTAFLYSVSGHKPSVTSNNSYCENPLFFNSSSLDASEPSNILSCSSFKTYDVFSKSEDLLNDAVFLSSDITKLTVNDFNNKAVNRRRAYSSIEVINKELNVNENLKKDDGFRRTCWSVPEFNAEHETLNQEVDLTDVEEKNEDELFNNSIHIEANFIASRIEDGSVFDDDFSTECLLDSTGPPDFSILDQCDADDINAEADINHSQKDLDILNDLNNTKESYKSVTNNSKNESYCQKFSSIQTSGSNCSSKSKNANELLHDLSLIINNEDRDPKQKREVQQLLSGIANILCPDSTQTSNKLENLEDSGHSSIEQEDQQNEQELLICYKVLDLRTNINKSNDIGEVLDLSMKSRNVQDNTKKRSSQSFSFPSSKKSSVKLLTGLKAGPSIKSSNSFDSKKDLSSKEFAKLKPKRIEPKANVRKGPLKAVIPLGNMAKNKSFVNKTQSLDCTPPKIEKNSSSFFKSKRTSTPIAEPSIKPMAQSTPDNKFQSDVDTKPISCSSQLKKRKFFCAVSPLVRPPSIGNMSSDSELNKTNHSGSAPNLSNVSDNSKKSTCKNSMIPSPKPIYRRHSATELKVTNSNNTSKLRRSYSIGKEAKPTLINRPSTSKQSAVNAVKKQNVLQENKGAATPKIKLFGLIGKPKKSVGNNKENVAR